MRHLLIVLLLLAGAAVADPMAETRYCHDPLTVPRADDGRILRDRSVVAAFKRVHPCPITRRTTGSCPGWAVDHVIPLAVGGCDAVSNMQWLPSGSKSCSSDFCKDRFERRIYGRKFGK